jgi:hypothetical protein
MYTYVNPYVFLQSYKNNEHRRKSVVSFLCLSCLFFVRFSFLRSTCAICTNPSSLSTGGREVYSQSKSRVGRHRRDATATAKQQRQSTSRKALDFEREEEISFSQEPIESIRPPQQTQASYRKAGDTGIYPRATSAAPASDSIHRAQNERKGLYERSAFVPPPPTLDGGEAVDVTHDLLEGGLCPPPAGLSVKEPVSDDMSQESKAAVDDLLAQTPVPPPMPEDEEDFKGSEDEDDIGRGCLDLEDSSSSATDNLRLGEEAGSTADALSPPSHVDPNKIIGSITIAEYEGSPRRYRPRMSPEAGEAGSREDSKQATPSPSIPPSSSKMRSRGLTPSKASGSARPPGFPQRIVPSTSSQASPASSSSSSSSRRNVPSSSPASSSSSVRTSMKQRTEARAARKARAGEAVSDVLLKFDEITDPERRKQDGVEKAPQPQPSACNEEVHGVKDVQLSSWEADIERLAAEAAASRAPAGTAITRTTTALSNNYNYQYEFSETRKVLDEFFKPAPEAGSALEEDEAVVRQREEDFGDLNYTLMRRRTEGPEQQSNCASQRFGTTDPEAVIIGGRSSTAGGGTESPYGHQTRARDLLKVGMSPLEPPSVSFGEHSVLHGGRPLMSSVSSAAPPMSTAPPTASGSNSSTGGGDTGYATLDSPEATRVAQALNRHHQPTHPTASLRPSHRRRERRRRSLYLLLAAAPRSRGNQRCRIPIMIRAISRCPRRQRTVTRPIWNLKYLSTRDLFTHRGRNCRRQCLYWKMAFPQGTLQI